MKAPGLDAIGKCLALLPRRLRLRWLALVPLALASAAAEAIGAALIFLLVRGLADPSSLATSAPIHVLVRFLPATGDRELVLGFTIAVAVFHLSKNLFVLATELVRAGCESESIAAVSAAMLRGYLALPYSRHLGRSSAELIRNAGVAVEAAYGSVMSPCVALATEALVVLGITAVLLFAAPLVTLAAATVLVALALLFLRATRGWSSRLGAEWQALEVSVLRQLQQSLGAIKEIKVLGRSGFFADGFTELHAKVAENRSRRLLLAIVPRVLVETFFVCGALALIALVMRLGRGAPETLSLLGLYAYAGFRIVPSMNRVLWQSSLVRVGSAAVELVHSDFAELARLQPADGDGRSLPFRDHLALEGVSYVYPGGDSAVLTDIDLSIRAGESVGVVGPTGAGKSTLIDLVTGLLDPTTGRISVDGVDVRGRLGAWRRKLGYVPQSIFLLDDTILRNVAVGIPDGEIDEARVRAAVTAAQLDDVLAAIPGGLDSAVGERGVRLAGGERQRIGIARALYHEPEVLILDEATSALDPGTEAALLDAVRDRRGQRRTLVMVTHRLETARRCDRLVYLHGGRIAGTGSFERLLAASVDFRHMARSGPA